MRFLLLLSLFITTQSRAQELALIGRVPASFGMQVNQYYQSEDNFRFNIYQNWSGAFTMELSSEEGSIRSYNHDAKKLNKILRRELRSISKRSKKQNLTITFISP